MQFLISDTFTESLARLTGEEQKAAKTTAFDLQLNPAQPGMKFHKIDKARDPNFWSVRVNKDLRIIVHRTSSNLLLCYVNHHDEAYRWARRRKLETHPKTGAAQLVEIRETVREVVVPDKKIVQQAPKTKVSKPSLFANISDEDLLEYGVPPEWLEDVREADEDSLLELAEHLPGEAAEALLDLAVGQTPTKTPPVTGINPFAHPDAQRRFRVVENVEEFKRALEYPWEKWMIFLHPAQRRFVESNFTGPARISGSAGTGKTVVALHRAVYLARKYPDARVLLATFSNALANNLGMKLRWLISDEPKLGERLDVHSMNEIGVRLYELNLGHVCLASKELIRDLLLKAADEVEGDKFSPHFLLTEWEQVVDAWQLKTWEEYRDVKRLGRKTRLPESKRVLLWAIFEKVRTRLESQGLITYPGLFEMLANHFKKSGYAPFDFAVIDESQDISVTQLKFLAAMGANRPDGLFFAGDLGQRIFQQPFSWKSLGVDIRGRSYTLRINYRTSHQIRRQTDRLLPPELTDVDGNKENRRGTISVFNGPDPVIKTYKTTEEEISEVGRWLSERYNEGILPHEMSIFVRSEAELGRARKAAEKAGLEYKILDENIETSRGHISISTMHLAKGLEFRAVAVMACDDEVIPLQERIERVADDADLEEVYNTERHLLYVACTRARDYLLVSGVEPASEFLDDMIMGE